MAALFISIPTSIFSFISFWAAIYICISCWFMKKLHDHRFNANYHDTRSLHNIGGCKSLSSRDPILRMLYTKYSTTTRSDEFISNYFEENDINNNWERPTLIMHHIFYMSACDSLISLLLFLNYIPQCFGNSNYSIFLWWNPLCYISSIILQFALCGTVIWYFVVGWNLFRIIFGLNETNFDKMKKYDSIAAWSIIIICTLIPIITNNYGEINNLSNHLTIDDKQCWINNELFHLCLYIPVLITILFAIFLLCSVIIKWYKHNETEKCSFCNICCLNAEYIFGGISIEDKQIVSRLTAFSLVFICVWIIPLINQFTDIITMEKRTVGLTAIGHYNIALIGTANCFIWSRSKNFKSFITSYKNINIELEDTRKKSVFHILKTNEFNI